MAFTIMRWLQQIPQVNHYKTARRPSRRAEFSSLSGRALAKQRAQQAAKAPAFAVTREVAFARNQANGDTGGNGKHRRSSVNLHNRSRNGARKNRT